MCYHKGCKNAYDEYISSKCEEIISNDETCKRLNAEILNIEYQFKKSLSEEKIRQFIKYESRVAFLEDYTNWLLYRVGCNNKHT